MKINIINNIKVVTKKKYQSKIIYKLLKKYIKNFKNYNSRTQIQISILNIYINIKNQLLKIKGNNLIPIKINYKK